MTFSTKPYATEAKRCGIAAALHMEVDVDPNEIEAEIGYIQGLSKKPGNLITGAIAACRPEEAGFAAYLERQRANPFVKGFRRVLHVVPDDVSEGALFRENIKRLGETGLSFDLCVLPHQIPNAIALADLAPDVQFILDHCGVPAIASGAVPAVAGQYERDRQTPECDRQDVPASSPMRRRKAGPSKPCVPMSSTRSHSSDGGRVVWGSDWPVCTLGGGLSTWTAATHALLAGCSQTERDQLLSGNAKRIWRL